MPNRESSSRSTVPVTPSSAAVTAPTTERGWASQRRIIDAAARLFYQRGVHATGLNDVAVASGTGKGQLYHYFESKEHLVSAVIAVQFERNLAAQAARLRSMATVEDLRGWAAEAVAQHAHGGMIRCPLGALVVELSHAHQQLKPALADGFVEWRKTLEVGLRALQDRGHVRADRTAADLAEVLLCAYEGGIVISEAHGDTRSLELALDAAVYYLLTSDKDAS